MTQTANILLVDQPTTAWTLGETIKTYEELREHVKAGRLLIYWAFTEPNQTCYIRHPATMNYLCRLTPDVVACDAVDGLYFLAEDAPKPYLFNPANRTVKASGLNYTRLWEPDSLVKNLDELKAYASLHATVLFRVPLVDYDATPSYEIYDVDTLSAKIEADQDDFSILIANRLLHFAAPTLPVDPTTAILPPDIARHA